MKNVGEILKNARENKKLTLEDLHKFVKIHPKYLQALEEGDYSIFSDKVHATGFLKIYAEFLDLDVSQVLAFWRREHEASFEKVIVKSPAFSLSSLEPYRFRLTPGVVIGTVVSILLFSFFAYLFYQYKTYSGAPVLDIYSPKDNIVVTSNILDITGKTERDSVIFINNQKINLSPDGRFATSIKLNDGINTLSFSTVNKLGRKTDAIRTIIYRTDRSETVAGVEDVNESSESTEATQPILD